MLKSKPRESGQSKAVVENLCIYGTDVAHCQTLSAAVGPVGRFVKVQDAAGLTLPLQVPKPMR